MRQLHIIDSGLLGAEENMEIDRDLLCSLDERPLLRFYGWRAPSITYGHFIKPEDLLDLNEIQKAGWEIAKRPTGGGIIFHCWDFTFSFLLPSSHPFFSEHTLNNYAFVHNILAESLHEIAGLDKVSLLQKADVTKDVQRENFCMAQPTVYDLVLQGKKVAGAAQRKTKKGYLHQGSISLECPDFDIIDRFLVGEEDLAAKILETTFPLNSVMKKENISQFLKTSLMEVFSATLDSSYAESRSQTVDASTSDKHDRSKRI